ncbi:MULTISPECIES: DapH/DapD/GlmU-related protein [unclassified Chryseobacterium]|uniref:DapH/DapD/GlmU-related protein n=1 Tax=unclassified Chryseobacterium TaxID=2593645 RepID=UPI00100AEF12|nr:MULTISPECIES: DapH/DapD/GlmU-related protein [unclassified Chryseobacterium]RXM50415.1 LpxA family transferase [Chryseobacterium sp. CH25]RXM64555.1 LpxA family transferase [Chryseobacterium sp. CH1]
MIVINHFIDSFSSFIPDQNIQPWEVIKTLEDIMDRKLSHLTDDFVIQESCAIHKTVIVEQNVTFKGLVIIDEGAFIGANAYIRGPVYIGKNVKIGPGSEIKQSIIFDETAVAHFNYIGNSIIGCRVNFEAGSICANHYNERKDKEISVLFNAKIIKTGTQKFGSLVGDDSKIGANAVLSPGTLLAKESIVKRLELVEQLPKT